MAFEIHNEYGHERLSTTDDHNDNPFCTIFIEFLYLATGNLSWMDPLKKNYLLLNNDQEAVLPNRI